jgi:hypothetical protein
VLAHFVRGKVGPDKIHSAVYVLVEKNLGGSFLKPHKPAEIIPSFSSKADTAPIGKPFGDGKAELFR